MAEALMRAVGMAGAVIGLAVTVRVAWRLRGPRPFGPLGALLLGLGGVGALLAYRAALDVTLGPRWALVLLGAGAALGLVAGLAVRVTRAGGLRCASSAGLIALPGGVALVATQVAATFGTETVLRVALGSLTATAAFALLAGVVLAARLIRPAPPRDVPAEVGPPEYVDVLEALLVLQAAPAAVRVGAPDTARDGVPSSVAPPGTTGSPPPAPSPTAPQPAGRPAAPRRHRWAIALLTAWALVATGLVLSTVGRGPGPAPSGSGGSAASVPSSTATVVPGTTGLAPATSDPGITTDPAASAPAAPTTAAAAVPPSPAPGSIRWSSPGGDADLLPPLTSVTGALVVGDASATVRALDPGTGAEQWRAAGTADLPALVTAAADGLYLTSGGEVARLEPGSGQRRWAVTLEWFNTFVSPPVAAGSFLVAGTDVVLVAIEPEAGQVMWEVGPGDDLFTARLAADAATVVALTERGARAFDVATGTGLWAIEADDDELFDGWPVIDGPAVVLSSGTRLRSVDLRTGAVRWIAMPDPGSVWMAPPTVHESVVYAVGGRVHALDATTGAVRWSSTLDAGPTAIDGRVVVAGDAVLVPAGDALLAVDAATGASRWRAPLLGELGAGVPAVADGTVYVADVGLAGSRVVALDLVTGVEQWAVPVEGEAHVDPPVIAAGLVVLPGRTAVVAVAR